MDALPLLLVLAINAQTQDYLYWAGRPTFTKDHPVELGFVNLANGNLHLEIELASAPQRGGIPYSARLVYDSRIWQIVNNAWQPTNVAGSQGGWRFMTTTDTGTVTYTQTTTNCGVGKVRNVWNNFVWTAPDNTRRRFHIEIIDDQCTLQQVSTGDAFANDSSGFRMTVSNFTTANVYLKNGIRFYPTTRDWNGNYFADGTDGRVDTLGKKPVITSSSGNQTYYDVLKSDGTRSRWTVTTALISVNTAFAQSGVTEYAGSITVIHRIDLPDGSSYIFDYDDGVTPGNYGVLTSMTLRTGGQVAYAYTTFADAYGTKNRWLSSRVSAGGTWNYTPAVITTCGPGDTGCQQKVTVTRPSGDEERYTFTLNNGAWNTQSEFFTGSATSGTLLETVVGEYDFSTPCPVGQCLGAIYIRPTRVTTTFPVPGGSISKKIEYSYDNGTYANVTQNREWKFYSGTPSASPDRKTDITYLFSSSYLSKTILDRPTTITVRDAASNQIKRTEITYDSTAITDVPGVIRHDGSFSTSMTTRGNPTLIKEWISGTTYRNTTQEYDKTGQVLKVTNPRGYIRSYSYADDYYTDNGANPPAAYTPSGVTNAFVTQVTLTDLPGSGKNYFSHYFHSGKLAFDRDQNLAAVYRHYLDSLDRQTHTYFRKLADDTRGWELTQYTSATDTGTYVGISDTTPSPSCTGCRQDREYLDTWGRPSQSKLVSDPEGVVFSDTTYDSSGRAQSRSNPYRNISDPTYGNESYQYDGLNRTTRTTRPDADYVQTFYGAAVTSGGGRSSQLCSSATYGLGYPTLTIDEAGKKRQIWNDGFGRLIEADEPDSGGSLNLGTCYLYDVLDNQTQVVQGVQTRTSAYDGLSRKTSETLPESGATNYFYTTSGGAICSGKADDLCRLTDARGVTTTYTYDSIDRLTLISYSDGTPTVDLHHDQSSFNGLTITFGGGRLTGMTDGSGQTAWSYDAAGNVVKERRTINGNVAVTKEIAYTYKLDNSVATITYPSGRVITYSYNNAARPVSAVDTANSINYATQATYAPHGAVASLKNGVTGGFTGITTTNSYNNRLQPAVLSAATTSQTVFSQSYAYDLGGGANNGSVSQARNDLVSGRTVDYTYDELNRVKTAQSQANSGPDCWGQSLGYDRYANLLSSTVTKCTAPMLSLSVNTSTNRITNTGFSYDAAGNMTNDGGQAYAWDGENRLSSTASVTYKYDGLGQRVKNTKLYWYGTSGEILEESDLNGGLIREFVYFSGERVARRDASGVVNYFFSDHLASARIVTNATGVVQQDTDYYAFGGEIGGPDENRYKFTGKERDVESNKDHSLHRMYSSNLGRWMSADPAECGPGDPQELNKYA